MAKPKNENSKPDGKRPLTTTESFERAIKGSALKRARYILRLYVTGSTGRSLQAVYNLKKICEEHLPDYDLEVIDIYKDPEAAREAQIIAAPKFEFLALYLTAAVYYWVVCLALSFGQNRVERRLERYVAR